jgi:hypothetical protein
MTLACQLVLTSTQLFEVHQTDALELLPQHVDLVIQACERANTAGSDEFFSVSFTRAALRAILSLMTQFSKFLSVKQLESMLKQTLLAEEHFSSDVESILLEVSAKAQKTLGHKQVFQAIFNCFDQTLMTHEVPHAKLPLVTLRFFRSLLQPSLEGMSKQFSEEFWSKISQFFREAFSLPQAVYKNSGRSDLAQLDEIETAIVEAFSKFVIKLNEDQLGPIVLKLVKWAKKSPKELYGQSELNFHR